MIGYKSVLVNGGGGGTEYTAGDGIDITEDVISTKKSQEGDIDEIIDVYPTAGNLVSIVNAFNKGDIYSSQERMIGQWIDGKPLYQLTYHISERLTVSPYAWGDITGLNVVNMWGNCKLYKSSASSYAGRMNFDGEFASTGSSDDQTISLKTNYQETQMVIYFNGDFHLEDTCVTIQYTKTTDSAISIGNDTEYSTDEKVVGTWIDGKPIYQKTITFSNITFNSANQYYYSLTGLDIDKAWVVNGFHYGGDYVQRPLDVLGQYKVTTWGIQNSSSPVPNSFYLQSSDGTAINRTFYITIQYTKTTT